MPRLDLTNKINKRWPQWLAMTNAPRQPIAGVNEDLIDPTAPNESQQSVQRRTIERRSRIAVVKAVGQKRPAVLSLGLQIQPACLVLDVARREGIRGTHRLAGVDSAPNRPSARRLFGGIEH
jgi:hypothetical protein